MSDDQQNCVTIITNDGVSVDVEENIYTECGTIKNALNLTEESSGGIPLPNISKETMNNIKEFFVNYHKKKRTPIESFYEITLVPKQNGPGVAAVEVPVRTRRAVQPPRPNPNDPVFVFLRALSPEAFNDLIHGGNYLDCAAITDFCLLFLLDNTDRLDIKNLRREFGLFDGYTDAEEAQILERFKGPPPALYFNQFS